MKMPPKQLTEWIQIEHAKVSDLLYLVRKHVAVPPREGHDRWLVEARACFGRLTDHLLKHFALEESGGYMAEVLERRPTLERDVQRLAREHAQLTRLMRQIQAELDEIRPEDHLLIRHCVSRIEMLLAYVAHHEESENHLVVYVFTQDMGTED